MVYNILYILIWYVYIDSRLIQTLTNSHNDCRHNISLNLKELGYNDNESY